MSILINNASNGFMPQPMPTTDTSQISLSRNTLVRAWNTLYPSQIKNKPRPRNTPFRIVNNAGDIYNRINYGCAGPCQTPQSRPGLYGLSQRFGSSNGVCDGTGVVAATCNPKYVYDGSDYTKYLKNKAILQGYNTISYGGDQYNASQVAVNAIKRF